MEKPANAGVAAGVAALAGSAMAREESPPSTLEASARLAAETVTLLPRPVEKPAKAGVAAGVAAVVAALAACQVDNQWTHRFVQNLNIKILKKKIILN